MNKTGVRMSSLWMIYFSKSKSFDERLEGYFIFLNEIALQEFECSFLRLIDLQRPIPIHLTIG